MRHSGEIRQFSDFLLEVRKIQSTISNSDFVKLFSCDETFGTRLKHFNYEHISSRAGTQQNTPTHLTYYYIKTTIMQQTDLLIKLHNHNNNSPSCSSCPLWCECSESAMFLEQFFTTTRENSWDTVNEGAWWLRYFYAAVYPMRRRNELNTWTKLRKYFVIFCRF